MNTSVKNLDERRKTEDKTIESLIQSWKVQSRRGLLELAILTILNTNHSLYLTDIMQMLKEYPLLNVSDNTIYPMIRRLKQLGIVESIWLAVEDGAKPTKAVSLTKFGKEYYKEIAAAWNEEQKQIEILRKNLGL